MFREQAGQLPAPLHVGEVVAIRRQLLGRGTTWPTSPFLPSELLAGAAPDLIGVAQAAVGLAAWRVAPLTALVDAEWEADQSELSNVAVRAAGHCGSVVATSALFVWQDGDVRTGCRH